MSYSYSLITKTASLSYLCVCVVNYFLYLNLLQPDQEIDCLSDLVCLDSEGVVPDGENYDTLMISSGIHIHTSSEDVIKNDPL